MGIDGVQGLLPGFLTAEERRVERRRAAQEIGLLKFERECRSVMVGARRLKAWRVPGCAEFTEHAIMVALLTSVFSGDE